MNLAEATRAYAAYLNASRDQLGSDDEQRQFDEDIVRARAAMEVAWLEAKRTR